jgi:sugar/nucleoside kinase (ribokinase family)
VCVSYLAAASLWRVERFPAPGHGAEVLATARSIAADGPMVAAVLAALGQPSLLLSNDIGDDASGSHVREWLTRFQVTATASVRTGLATPQIVVVGDDLETRTMFPYVPGVADGLASIALEPLASAALAYIDCYRFMTAPAARAIAAARTAGAPIPDRGIVARCDLDGHLGRRDPRVICHSGWPCLCRLYGIPVGSRQRGLITGRPAVRLATKCRTPET